MPALSARPGSSGLWRHPDFLKLWAGQTVSLFGTQVTALALPLVAVASLGASSWQMGLLRAAQTAPALLLGLLAGAWVDRLRRRPILIAGDLGRAACVGLIPLAAVLDLLRLEVLYAVGFAAAALTVFFDVASMSFVPTLVRREELVDANSKLEGSFAVASIAGPGLTAALIQLVTAPFALVADALSYLVSALAVALIRTPEPAPHPGGARREGRRTIWAEIGEGLRLVAGHPLLRPMAIMAALTNAWLGIHGTLYILYLTRELGFGPAAVPILFSFIGPGFLLGSLVVGPIARRFGPGPTLLGTTLVTAATVWVFPLASGSPAVVAPLFAAAQFVSALSGMVNQVTYGSLRQAITPHHLLGRMTASMRFIAWSIMPLAGLAAGYLGGAIGLRATLAVEAAVALLAPLVVWFSPLPKLREQPQPEE